jgi:hypothetical protein
LSGIPDSFEPLEGYLSKLAGTFQARSSSPSEKITTLPPWFPFKSRQDFEFAEYAVMKQLSNTDIDLLLENMRSSWCEVLKVTFRTHRDIANAIANADNLDSTQVCI